jgi:hypothetical protein
MTSTFEFRLKPKLCDLTSQSWTDNAFAHRQDVRVVVLPRRFRTERIMDERCSDALDLVRCDTDPNACATN